MKNKKFSGNPVPGQLPSYLQLGDYCDFVVMNGTDHQLPNQLWAGQVIKVHFTISKVMYDLEYTVSIDHKTDTRHVTRIHNIDSAFLVKREEGKEYSDGIKVVDVGQQFFPDSQPPATPSNEESVSFDVLCDMNGNKKNWAIGWYDFDEKSWRFYQEDTSFLEPGHMVWTYLPK